ncbi:MAG TPA: hypothetical protein VEA59_04590 [Patescibacteria group bacterium]|nr:hypothetical protein [Patescibacteria group bacterium]
MTQHKVITQAFLHWLPIATAIVVVSGIAYASSQFIIRSSANDAPLQLSESALAAIEQGAPLEQLLPPTSDSDITKGTAPFAVLINGTGTPVGSTGMLDGKIPVPPQGALDAAKKKGEHRLTWEPKNGQRFATVITSIPGPQGGYVIVGKTLKETDARINKLCLMAALGALAALAASFILSYVAHSVIRKKSTEPAQQ